jgi:alpha-2-macroglobulin
VTSLYRSKIGWGAALVAAIGAAGIISSADEADPSVPPKIASTPKLAIEPAAPLVSPEVIAALQSGQFENARKPLATLREKAKTTDEASYFAYLQAIAERLSGQRDAARETLRTAIQADPSSRWAPKMRFELAGLDQASGNWPAAEELARAEATRLLAGDRKDQLAQVYHAFARRLLEPNDPLIPADPNGAYELLAQARDLAESPALRAQLLFAMGRSSLTVSNPSRAIDNFQQYLRGCLEI